jgi:hypothetical protein
VVGRDADPGQRDGQPRDHVAVAQARQAHSDSGDEQPDRDQPAEPTAVGDNAKGRLNRAGQEGRREREAGEPRVGVVPLDGEERQQRGHCPLIKVVDRVGSGQQHEDRTASGD